MSGNEADGGAQRTVLLYEPRAEGHHPPWLRMIIEDLLAAEFRVALALPQEPRFRERINAILGDLLPRVQQFDVPGNAHGTSGAAHLVRAAQCQAQCGADYAFFCCFDEIGSSCLRRAGFGRMPPPGLRGRLGGVYMRPRFLAPGKIGFNEMFKRAGFRRLARGGWFAAMLFLDELLSDRARSELPGSPFFWLPDPATQAFDFPGGEARTRLRLPANKRIFLFYGGPYRRKGLHVVLAAMLQLPASHPSFLLCVGLQPSNPEIATGLARLAAQGRAFALNQYVSPEDERIAFGACDFVLLPYLNHFGSSGVQAQAAAAGKPIIASDENVVGRRVRQYGTGWLFPTADVDGLREIIEKATHASEAERQQLVRGAVDFTVRFSRNEFRRQLLRAFGCEPGIIDSTLCKIA